MLLTNARVKRPSSTKIQSRNGVRYVYQVVGQIYNKEKKYTVDKRKVIGKMIDDEWMIPNEAFSDFYPDVTIEMECPDFSDTLKTGTFLVIQRIMKDLQITDVLDGVFGDRAQLIEDVVSYIVSSESCTFQYYSSFMRNHPQMEDRIRDDTMISRLLKTIGEEETGLFMTAWNEMQKNDDFIYIGYDSTNFNTYAQGIEFSDYGKAKLDEGLPQINLSYSVRQDDSCPLFYELYDGSINDNAQFMWMAELAKEYGYQNIGFLLDRGYISEKNISAMRRHGYAFVLMLKENQVVCQEVLEENGALLSTLEGYYIPEHGVYGMTVKKELYGEKTNIHIFYDDIRASEEKKALMERCHTWEKELDKMVERKTCVEGELKKYEKLFRLHYDMNGYFKGYERNSRAIRNEMKKLGYFFIASSEDMDAGTVLDIYRGRDNIEKMFRSLKSGIDFEKARVHTTESLKAKVFLVFIAMIIRNEMFQKMRELKKKNRKYYTVPGVISELENIECTRNSGGRYRRKYALTAKQKTILKEFGIDEKHLDNAIAGYTY